VPKNENVYGAGAPEQGIFFPAYEIDQMFGKLSPRFQ
jgi:hypothetical protein